MGSRLLLPKAQLSRSLAVKALLEHQPGESRPGAPIMHSPRRLRQWRTQPPTHINIARAVETAYTVTQTGRMFWLWWKTLSGSYVVFTSTSRL